jgi:hypothetical protein
VWYTPTVGGPEIAALDAYDENTMVTPEQGAGAQHDGHEEGERSRPNTAASSPAERTKTVDYDRLILATGVEYPERLIFAATPHAQQRKAQIHVRLDET